MYTAWKVYTAASGKPTQLKLTYIQFRKSVHEVSEYVHGFEKDVHSFNLHTHTHRLEKVYTAASEYVHGLQLYAQLVLECVHEWFKFVHRSFLRTQLVSVGAHGFQNVHMAFLEPTHTHITYFKRCPWKKKTYTNLKTYTACFSRCTRT